MNIHQRLGQLSSLQQMLVQLVQNAPAALPPEREPPLEWYLGRAVYLESYRVREQLLQQDDLTSRVHHLFAAGTTPVPDLWAQLPPRDHLLNWALELQEQNLTLLANPSQLPQNSRDECPRTVTLLLQELALIYEQMLQRLTLAKAQQSFDFTVSDPLVPGLPSSDRAQLAKGHFRIGGARDEVVLDAEQPPQMVELSAFAIDRTPVSNAGWLAFLEQGGYREDSLWDDEAEARTIAACGAPAYWRQDRRGNWYAVGLQGPYPLEQEQPVTGISWYEARAYARWLQQQGGALAGAALAHEYQCEIAARLGVLQQHHPVVTWCSNTCEPYQQYQPPADPESRCELFDRHLISQRGQTLHSLPALRRSSLRRAAAPDQRSPFVGLRLIHPPD